MKYAAAISSVLLVYTQSVFAQERPARRDAPRPPNIIYIMADDLGYAELGCYGQAKIRTPNIDSLAAKGIKLTQHYSGSPVCAPSRCVLMTGMHTGHSYIRDNREIKPEGQEPILPDVVTLGELMKRQGYVTGVIGKWGLGGPGSTGEPNDQGFDFWFGYLCQREAHNLYPTHLWRNGERIDLEGNVKGNLVGAQYSHDLMAEEALAFIREHQDEPFFLYVPFHIPHLAIQVPEDSLNEYKGLWDDPPYEGGKGYLPHPAPRAGYAAMITRMDRDIGRIINLVKELGLDDNTMIVFTSDNGPTYDRLGGSDSEFFESTPFRGLKGSLYEGGIRVPWVARWPGKIEPGTVSDHVCAFWDVLPTILEIVGGVPPRNADGLSFAPVVLGRPDEQMAHEYLYWEFPSYGGQQAVRMGDWKGIRTGMFKGNMKIELYDLAADPTESRDIAALLPETVARIDTIMLSGRSPSNIFPFKQLDTLEQSE